MIEIEKHDRRKNPMKILVCIKQVPDTVEVKIDPKTGTLIRDGVPSIINHDDKTGIEAALRIKEQVGGTVTVVSMGPPQADVALREALAMGCDEAYLVSGREFGGSDTYATSGIIAAALKKIGYDLIITGRQAIDGDTAQVGPQIAEKLTLPQVSYVEEVIEATEEYVAAYMLDDVHYFVSVDPLKTGVVRAWDILDATGYLGEDCDINIEDHINTTLYEEALAEATELYGAENPEFYAAQLEFFNANNK